MQLLLYASVAASSRGVDQSRCLPNTRDVEVYFNIRQIDQRQLEIWSGNGNPRSKF
jgi:hypothetical protein